MTTTITCPEPARTAAEQEEHESHCCECGKTGDGFYWELRDSTYRRCNECYREWYRTMMICSSQRPERGKRVQAS